MAILSIARLISRFGRGFASFGKRLTRIRRWLAVFLLLGLAFSTARAGAPISDEYRVKAVFLFNFAQFVDWPVGVFSSGTAPIVIGVLGEDPFGTYLDDLVNGEKVGARALEIHRFKRSDDFSGCHLLFISRSEAPALDKIIARLKGKSVLTLGDLDSFTRDGGMVRFATESGKIRLRINVEAAKACGLTISSKLIRPATLVTTGRD